MPINVENIEKEYQESKTKFEDITRDIQTTLLRAAKKYYGDTRFQVYIPPLRIKMISSIIGKLQRKGRDAESLFQKDGQTMKLVTNDFIGGRILCNTQDDVEAIGNILEKWPRLKIEKRDLINKDNGYSALHLDIFYETYWEDQMVNIPLELQIKTHFQHAWAEITHDDDYKPDSSTSLDESLKAYYTNISVVLRGLDGFLTTIRAQKLSLITPPSHLTAADTIINSKTLSFTINKWKRGEQLTIQEMSILLKRLKDEAFETIEDVELLINDSLIEKHIKVEKEDLSINENVSAFEMIKYGSLIARRKKLLFEEEIKFDLGFVKEACSDCGRNLTREELAFMTDQTDTDTQYYCEGHRNKHFTDKCVNCGRLSSQKYCINCAAELESERI